MENDGVAGGFELAAILVESARILVEILALPELQAVDENRRHRDRSMLARELDQAQMPVMHIAHGRDAGYLRFFFQPLAQRVDCCYDFHSP